MTLRDKLKALGQTEEQINATLGTLGNNTALFEKIITDAANESSVAATKLAEANSKEQQVNDFWTKEATPQINEAFSEVASAKARAAFFETQVTEAKKAGFLPGNTPGFTASPNPANPNPAGPANPPTRNERGEFVPNGNPVPGSPQYMTMEQATAALAETSYLMTEHQRLFNEPLPDLQLLMSEAVQTRSKARDVWSKKYGVEAKRKEISDAAQKKHDDEIRADERKKTSAEYADKYGNENTRPMLPSRYPSYARDEKTGAPNKLAWTKKDRHDVLRSRIMQQVEKEQTVH